MAQRPGLPLVWRGLQEQPEQGVCLRTAAVTLHERFVE